MCRPYFTSIERRLGCFVNRSAPRRESGPVRPELTLILVPHFPIGGNPCHRTTAVMDGGKDSQAAGLLLEAYIGDRDLQGACRAFPLRAQLAEGHVYSLAR